MFFDENKYNMFIVQYTHTTVSSHSGHRVCIFIVQCVHLMTP